MAGIKGVSHRAPFAKHGSQREKYTIEDDDIAYIRTELKYHQSFEPLNQDSISMLLQDHGKNILHTYINECVEKITHWKKIFRIIGGAIKDPQHFSQSLLNDDKKERIVRYTEEELVLFAQAKSVYYSWKLRLEILEMITNGQKIVNDEKKESHSNRHRYPK